MNARKLIAKLRAILDKGVDVSIATGKFTFRFPDGTLRIVDLTEIDTISDAVSKVDGPLVFVKDINQ